MYISTSRDCFNCGSDHKTQPFVTYHDGYHCFSCGVTKRADRSFSAKYDSVVLEIEELPNLITEPGQFSLENYIWLNSYFMTDDLIRKHHIAECERGSLVFSHIVDGQVVHYQQRWIEERKFRTGGQKRTMINSIDSDTIVIVEDFISAARVGEFVDVACLFGTFLMNKDAKEMLKKYKRIVIWLDNDDKKKSNSGQIAAVKIMNNFKYLMSLEDNRKSFGGNNIVLLQNISTQFDPKVYSNSEIKEILGV